MLAVGALEEVRALVAAGLSPELPIMRAHGVPSLAAHLRGALSLAAAYAPAIEYRAEAYLGLDQVEDAKKAYLQLFPNDRSHADELLTAMKGWVQKRQSNPGSLTPEMVQSFSTWVQEREELAKQTPSVSELRTRKW